jgi:hypothetical protein
MRTGFDKSRSDLNRALGVGPKGEAAGRVILAPQPDF